MLKAPPGGPRCGLLPAPSCSGIRDPLLTRRPPPAEKAREAPARAQGRRQRPGFLKPHAHSACLLGRQHHPPSSGSPRLPDVAGTCPRGLPPLCPKSSSPPTPRISTLGLLLPPSEGRFGHWALSWESGDLKSAGTPGRGRHRGPLPGDDPGRAVPRLWEQARAWRPARVGFGVLLGKLPGAAGERGPWPAPRGGVWTSARGGRTPGPGRLLAFAPPSRPAPWGGMSRPRMARGGSHR